MKKMLNLLIGILILSMMFTACSTPAESPTDVESKGSQQEKTSAQEVASQADSLNNDEQQEGVSVPSEETQKDEGSKETQERVESVDEAQTQEEEINADEASLPQPEFNTVDSLQNWLLSQDDTDQFAQDKQDLLATMESGKQITYYRPTLRNGNDTWRLDKVRASYGVLRYYYKSIVCNLKLQFSCYMDDTNKELYDNTSTEAKNNIGGRLLANENGHEIIYYNNELSSVTVFCWPQFGGFISAYLKGKNYTDKVQEVLPYMNLEKVTLRTDLETH